MSWEYDVKEHKFYLDGVYQFDADYAGASGYKNDLILTRHLRTAFVS